MMTSREFAKLIGVSQSTVSRAMNNSDLVPPKKREFILQKAREYGFALNSQAISLKTNKTGTIGILFPKHFTSMNANLMLAHIYDCIQKEMNNYDYDIMVIYYDRESDDFSSFERIIKKRKVDGFIVLRMELSDSEMQLIKDYQVPCVFMMNAGSTIREQLNYFFSDSEYGGYLAGCFFGKCRAYQKLFITVKEERGDAQRRFKGYLRGLKEYGYEISENEIIYCNLSITSAYDCLVSNVEKLRGKRTAIFTYSDIIGLGVINACKDMGFKLPEEVQIIGMDDIPLAGWSRPGLSTVHVKAEEMVPKGCRRLIDLIERECDVVQEWIKPRLILRDTTVKDSESYEV